MREIKFRAWDKESKRMHFNVGTSFSDCGQAIELERMMMNPDNVPLTYPIEYFELMQFTGLLDKNGKEIYEGDIVSFKHKRSQRLTDLFPPQEIKDITDIPIQVWMSVVCQGSSKESDGEIEVIGNIYENPELLAQKKD